MKNTLMRITLILLSATIFLTDTVHVFAANLKSKKNKDLVVVEIVYTDCAENEIAEWVLDDGTAIGEHEHVIKYNKVQSRAVDEPGNGGNGYFSSVAWITRDGVVSLQLAPTSKTRQNWSNAKAGWDVLASATTITSSVYWPKDTTCLFWQYQCHYNFANNKAYWNLEPSRTASSYTMVVANACNP